MRRRQRLGAQQRSKEPQKVVIEIHENGDVDYHYYPHAVSEQLPNVIKRRGRPPKQIATAKLDVDMVE
jgi:hypothetical protein